MLPMPLNLVDLYGINAGDGKQLPKMISLTADGNLSDSKSSDYSLPKVVALAASDSYLLILREDGILYSIDPETGKVKEKLEFRKQMQNVRGFKIRKNGLYYFDDAQLGKSTRLFLWRKNQANR